MSRGIDVDFRKLVISNPGNCSLREYQYIGELIGSLSPGNILVFGLGNDSPYWMDINSGGQTLFLEDSEYWIQKVKSKTSGIAVEKIEYTTKRRQWRRIIEQPDKLQLVLPETVLDTFWDVIFIDAPRGNKGRYPGRMQSIFSASNLNYKHILAHDCNRRVERVYFQKFIGQPTHVVDKLFHKLG